MWLRLHHFFLGTYGKYSYIFYNPNSFVNKIKFFLGAVCGFHWRWPLQTRCVGLCAVVNLLINFIFYTFANVYG